MNNPSGFSESRKKKKIQTSLLAATACTQEKLAETLLKNRKLKEAEDVYRRLISLGVANHISYVNLALICGMAGKFDEILDLLKRALEINSNHANTYNLLGLELYRLNETSQAIAAYEKATELQPNLWNAHFNLGKLHSDQSRYSEAILIFQNLVENNPDHQEAHLQLGFALLEQRELDVALLSLENSLEIKPDCAKTFFYLGLLYKLKGDLCLSIRYFEESVKLNPNHSVAQAAFSLVLLLAGNYDLGLEKYEFRSNDPNYTKPIALPSCELWDGRKLTFDDQLIVVCEQGIGDTFQFMRYVFHMKKQGYNVSLCVYTKLAAVIASSCPELPLLTPQEANEMKDNYWIPMLSLPRQLGVRPENPIVSDPYIVIKDSLILEWKLKLLNNTKSNKNLIVAVNWQGNPLSEKNHFRGRSIPLEAFSRLASCACVDFISLQKGFGSEQLESCSFRDRFVSCQDQISGTWDFLETAAIIANCDLVITSDTSVAHLAGGMGKTTWLLLHKVPDWRWGLEGDTTFWYPCMRLFRQKEHGNWNEVMERVAEKLQEYSGYNSDTAQVASVPASFTQLEPIQGIQAPISLGELIDKISILQIKSQHLQGIAFVNVKKELDALQITLNNLQLDIEPTLIQHLKEVNQKLWQIEDDIRDLEQQKNFGEIFIHLARSVYQQNDQRAAIKKEINTTYGSAFVEEKSYKEYVHKSDQQATSDTSQDIPSWETMAITIEPKGQRYAEFKSNNNHLEITPFTAIRGTNISKEEAIGQGLATEELVATSLLTPGALGCAASHRAIWARCSIGNKGFLVMEDNCYTHPEINDFIVERLERLISADICFFGINTDSILQSVSPSNLFRLSLFSPKNPSPSWIHAALSKTNIRNVELHKLEKAFGTCAYFISPKGAQRLIKMIFPLSLKTTNIPLITDEMPAISIDRSGCSIYSQVDALVCEPFLSYTPNIDSSTKNNPDYK